MEFTFGGDRKKIEKIWEEREQQDASNVLAIDFAKILKGEEISIKEFWNHADDYFDARDSESKNETLKITADELANSIAMLLCEEKVVIKNLHAQVRFFFKALEDAIVEYMKAISPCTGS